MSLTTKTITVEYYAQLREQSGLNRESMTTNAVTMRQLYEQLQSRHGFSLPSDVLKVAANASFCGWEREVAEGDLIVFIPPVAGG